ncbi:phage tail protein [Nocardia cyriacigeorgica]|uniref:phage tail protein n=1 Tax=Nocardia cyriacigeorgica TaxID=135487 RepID=UPI0018937437|nr:phage tail protein [Nocardia cyriacigeorgica]MBF6085227.1 phage tail protein [Nocardia cyriacigeorgica]
MPRTLVEVEGCDGTWFTISGRGMGAQGVLLGTDVEGIYDAPVRTIYASHAAQIGSTYYGHRNLQRDVVFGVTIGSTERTWGENDSAWRKAWSYSQDTTLWVTTETSRRYLKLRLSEQPQFTPETDPHLRKSERVVMTCVAADPWWYEASVTDEFVTDAVAESGYVTVSNPCDQEIWLQWIAQGPGRWVLPDHSWGDNRWRRAISDAARAISLPKANPSQVFWVNTDPFADQLRDLNGSQVWSLMKGVTFMYPIPPYTPPTQVPVSVSESEQGAGLQVICPRTWSRPWGLQ